MGPTATCRRIINYDSQSITRNINYNDIRRVTIIINCFISINLHHPLSLYVFGVKNHYELQGSGTQLHLPLRADNAKLSPPYGYIILV